MQQYSFNIRYIDNEARVFSYESDVFFDEDECREAMEEEADELEDHGFEVIDDGVNEVVE